VPDQAAGHTNGWRVIVDACEGGGSGAPVVEQRRESG
jgi:hypothetical protein